MNKWKRKLVIAGVCLCTAMGAISGCGAKADTTIATLDGQPVEFGVASFLVRYSQAQMQTMYGSFLGEGYWKSNGDTTREGMLESLEEMLILEQHADEYKITLTEEDKTKITEAAKAFMDTNSDDVIKALSVDQETVERTLTLYTIKSRMSIAMVADVDTNVSDEEAAQKTIQYALFSTADTTDGDGNSVAKTEEEKAELKEQAQQVLDAVKSGDDLDTALKAVDEEKTSSTASYGKDNGDIEDEVKEAADKLKDGEYADSVIETEKGYYVVVMKAVFDEEATESQKTTIINQRKSDKYDEIYKEWKEAADFEVKDSVAEKIKFNDVYEMKVPETEAGTETQTEAGSESESETQTETETASGSETETQAETQGETGTD